MRKFFKTLFPRFSSSEVVQELPPDLTEIAESESSAEDDLHRKLEEQYSTKLDEDVAVFMDIARQMSLSSLVFLLQNHVQAQNFPESYLKPQLAPISSNVPKPALPKQKQFRFAEVTGGNVRAVVHEIPRTDDPSLWWDTASQGEIRKECLNTVNYYRKYRPDYSDNIMALAQSSDCDPDDRGAIEETIKRLGQDATARGLEVHIVKLLTQLKNDTVQAVLEAQRQDGIIDREGFIRLKSTEASLPARILSEQLGYGDRVEALKASLSRWRRAARVDTETWWEC